jgi:hypothetical protein
MHSLHCSKLIDVTTVNDRVKGIVSRDFRPSIFFSSKNPLGPQIHGVKLFYILLQIRVDSRLFIRRFL